MGSESDSVVICGALADDHVRAVRHRLQAQGVEVFILDPLSFPRELNITLGSEPQDIQVGDHLSRPAAVYLRSAYQSPAGYGTDADAAMQRDWRQTLIKYKERNTLIAALLYRWEDLGVPLYNPLSAQRNITKPYQLARLAAAGLPVPRTLWTNDPDAVRRFAGGDSVIYKPVAGGASTKVLQERDLTLERLAKLRAAPVTFQELLPGDDIRVYVVDGQVVARLRILTDAIDFRQNETAIEPVELPIEVERYCVEATRVLGLRFTGMDLKADRSGVLKILELNPSAMFLGFDAMAGSDVLGALTKALASHCA